MVELPATRWREFILTWPDSRRPLTLQGFCYESDMGCPESGSHVVNLVLKILETR